jgi:branched-chain amino acid transport system ATP-binding protein
MLRVEGITVAYGRIRALRDVSLEVEKGELCAVVGPNGAGKSTLLLAIAGAVAPASGSIVLDGKQLSGLSVEEVAWRGISLVPERRRLFFRMSVEENLLLGATTSRDRSSIRDDIERVTTRFPILRERLGSDASTLSGGEQQQLALARALISRPKVLLIDEPSLGLAPRLVEQIFQHCDELRREGATILLVEQAALRAARLADRTYLLQNGRLALSGHRDEIVNKWDLWSSYLGQPLQPKDSTKSPAIAKARRTEP